MLSLLLASVGAMPTARLLLFLAIGLGFDARHWLVLAERSRVGARSEDEVHRALAPLQAEGWRLRPSLPWRGRGDIDSLAVAPTGAAYVVETKTRTDDDRHLARVREQAVVPARRGAGDVPGSRAWHRAGRAGRAGGLDRSAHGAAAERAFWLGRAAAAEPRRPGGRAG
jgi:hypothetical protein